MKTVKEGQTYQTNTNATTFSDIESIPFIATLSKETTFIAFDIEATWLSRSSDITQLSADNGKDSFNVYIDPRQSISQKQLISQGCPTVSKKKNSNIDIEKK